MTTERIVCIDYTNYRGERAWRKIVPQSIHFVSTEHHPEPQWILEAWDCDKGAPRSFAMRDIHGWRVEDPEPDQEAVSASILVERSSVTVRIYPDGKEEVV